MVCGVETKTEEAKCIIMMTIVVGIELCRMGGCGYGIIGSPLTFPLLFSRDGVVCCTSSLQGWTSGLEHVGAERGLAEREGWLTGDGSDGGAVLARPQ